MKRIAICRILGVMLSMGGLTLTAGAQATAAQRDHSGGMMGGGSGWMGGYGGAWLPILVVVVVGFVVWTVARGRNTN